MRMFRILYLSIPMLYSFLQKGVFGLGRILSTTPRQREFNQLPSFLFFIAMASLLAGTACNKEENVNGGCDPCLDTDLISGTYDPQPYVLSLPPRWKADIPVDNPLTKDGVELGRRLFFDPILSADSTMSCASCHQPEKAFTDGRAVSPGILGQTGTRNAMALVNLAFNANGFFWDGRAATLEDQALAPVEDHLELNETWDNVEKKLRRHSEYPALFRRAFGIERRSQLTRQLAVKAIAQFERTLLSTNSRYDQVVERNEGWFTDAELRGKQLFFFEELQTVDHPGCSHCHFNPFFTNNDYSNNGLDSVARLEDFPDPGRGKVTGRRYDLGRFRVPTLRNIELTGPYMHDGRFKTLEEVLDHYSQGGHGTENEDVNIRPFPLSERDKQDLIAFLRTLTDTTFTRNPAFQNPFR